MGSPETPLNLLSQLRVSLHRVYENQVASSRNLSGLPEFTGNSSHSFKDWNQTVVSFCSTLSKAYERQLETESDGISLTDIAMFLPSWFEINPVLDDPDCSFAAS